MWLNSSRHRKPEELIRLSKESILKRTLEEQKEITEQMIDIIAEKLCYSFIDAPSSFMYNQSSY